MKDASRCLRDLVDRSRDADDPTIEDKARVRQALTRALAGAPPGGPSRSGVGRWVGPGLAVLALLGGGAYGVWELFADSGQPEAGTAPIVEPARETEASVGSPAPASVIAPPDVEPTQAKQDPGTPPPADRPVGVPARRRTQKPASGRLGTVAKAPPSPPSPQPLPPPPPAEPEPVPEDDPPVEKPAPNEAARASPFDLAEELRLLREAQVHLSEERPDTALDLLAEHATRFPRGVLREERLAAQTLALCALGRIKEARAAASTLRIEAPRSPQLPRLRSSCVESGEARGPR